MDMSFTTQERERAARWKQTTGTLPVEAKVPAPYRRASSPDATEYEFCLPIKFAELSLLPEVRPQALALFETLGIPWHMGVGKGPRKGPSNHLLSSQVQCVNALGQMVSDAERVKRAFGPTLETDEVLEIESGRFMTFEFIGDVDYFNEARAGRRVRGSQCTSVDAAFLHRTAAGVTELVLVEWKYTESYPRRKPDPDRDPVRRKRYEPALSLDDSPVRADVLTFDDLLDEPLYQLMRQQLFAAALERDHALGADVVRVVHVHPAENLAYQQSIHRTSQKAVGATVAEVWDKLLRRSDRYSTMDNAVFLDPAITSDEYVTRYGG